MYLIVSSYTSSWVKYLSVAKKKKNRPISPHREQNLYGKKRIIRKKDGSKNNQMSKNKIHSH